MTVFQPVEAEEVFLLKIFAEEQAENGITYVVVFNAFHLLLWEIKISEFFSWDMDKANFWVKEITTMLHWKSWRLKNKGQDL